jgi:hypothetical protein
MRLLQKAKKGLEFNNLAHYQACIFLAVQFIKVE